MYHLKYKIYFLAGLLDTDGGKKASGFGFTTASICLSNFVNYMFSKLNFDFRYCPWKKKNHIYHQIYLNKKESINLLNVIPLKNKEKREFIRSLCPGSSVGRALEN